MGNSNMYSIYDKKSLSYSRPFFAKTNGEALRIFMDEVNRPGEHSMLYKYSGDFDLYAVGSFDERIGVLTAHEQPSMLANGSDVKAVDS